MKTRPPRMPRRISTQATIIHPATKKSVSATMTRRRSAPRGATARRVEKNGCQRRKRPKCTSIQVRTKALPGSEMSAMWSAKSIAGTMKRGAFSSPRAPVGAPTSGVEIMDKGSVTQITLLG